MDFVEFFAGGGGTHIGLKQAGLTPRLAVEWNSDCRETLRANDPGVAIDRSNMSKTTVAKVLRSHGIGPDYKGLIWLSPPCQGVSEAGKKLGKYDKRNNLLYTVSDACRYAPNAWVIMEQVRGLKVGKAKPLFRRLRKRIRKTGRTFSVWILKAVEFGLAQKRVRLFLVSPPFCQPVPPKPVGTWAGQSPKTLEQAIRPGHCDFVDDTLTIPLLPNEAVLMQGIPPGGNWTSPGCFRAREYMYGYYWRKKAKVEAEGDVMPELSDDLFKNSLRRLSWKKPSPTIVASWPQAYNFRVHPIHPQEPRYLSNGECKELQGFPRDYYFHGSHRTEKKIVDGKVKERKITPAMSVRRQIGNAVPPPFAKAIGEAILAASIESHGATSTQTRRF